MAEQNKQKQENIYVAAFKDGMAKGDDLNKAKADMRVTIAQRIRSCRAAAKLTQEQVSEHINANSLTYRGYENCRSDIPVAYLIRLADLFGVSLDFMTGRTENKDGWQSPQKAADSTDARIEQLEKLVSQLMNAQQNGD